MRALIQRVRKASVEVDQKCVGQISEGVLLLLGVAKNDTPEVAERMLEKILNYRIFDNEVGRMDLSLRDTQGGLLVVSQFTLVADTKKGRKPSFSSAASPEHGESIYDHFVECAKVVHNNVATGKFGADMQVELVNNGPVTFLLEIE